MVLWSESGYPQANMHKLIFSQTIFSLTHPEKGVARWDPTDDAPRVVCVHGNFRFLEPRVHSKFLGQHAIRK